jgi:hypothetical protein
LRPCLPKDNVAGVNVAWANADEPRTSRQSKRRIPPKNTLVPCFAALELELWKQLERREQPSGFILVDLRAQNVGIRLLASGGAASQRAGTALRRGETISRQEVYPFG